MLNPLWFVIFPFIACALTFILPLTIAKNVKRFAFILSLLPLLALILQGTNLINADCNYTWIKSLGIQFHLHVDSLSFVFLFLVNIIIPISILADKEAHTARFFYGLILLLQGLLNGFFTTQDLAVFTFFWEGMLVPLYFLINLWGGKEKQKASYTFIIYMIAGSFLMVGAVLALYFSTSRAGEHTFDMPTLAQFAENAPLSALISFIFLLAFAVKTPLFPFHGWLPIAYTESSTGGTILLSAILSKAGVYGILRISLKMFPNYLIEWSPTLLVLAIIGVLYGAVAAWAQTDFKKLIAYSSFSHINFVLAGLFVWDLTSQSGAIIQALNHAVTIAGLFLVAGWLEARLGTRSMGAAHGLAKYMPHLCWLTVFFALSAVALPGLNNFVGEVLILYGVFAQNGYTAAILGLTVILSVIYMLRFVHSIYFETPSPFQPSWVDIRPKESMLLVPLIALVLWLGIYPMPALKQIAPAAEKIQMIGNGSAS